jgi:hypothetical protein
MKHRKQPRPATSPDGGENPLPWETDPPPAEERGADGRRVRHDAFTPRRKHEFLGKLAKSGTIEDAARAVGVDPRTVYRHQEKDPEFLEHCRIALRMSATPIELTAWQRAVEGVEQEFACGGQVHVRRRYDAGLLRLLLQASNPKKFGPRPGFTRKRLLRQERKQMEREIHAEIRARQPSRETLLASIRGKLQAIARHRDQNRLEEGWTLLEDGHWIPPGYGPLPGTGGAPSTGEAGEGPRETM